MIDDASLGGDRLRLADSTMDAPWLGPVALSSLLPPGVGRQQLATCTCDNTGAARLDRSEAGNRSGCGAARLKYLALASTHARIVHAGEMLGVDKSTDRDDVTSETSGVALDDVDDVSSSWTLTDCHTLKHSSVAFSLIGPDSSGHGRRNKRRLGGSSGNSPLLSLAPSQSLNPSRTWLLS